MVSEGRKLSTFLLLSIRTNLLNVSHDAPNDAKTFLNAICTLTEAEPVTIIGNEVVIYRRSSSKDINHFEI